VDDDIIRQKQRNVKDPMISKQLITSILFSSAIMIIGTLGVFYKEVSAILFINSSLTLLDVGGR
jgi:hypothetical protein